MQKVYKNWYAKVPTIPLPLFSLVVISDIIVVHKVTEPFVRPPIIRDIKNTVKTFAFHQTK